MGKIENSLKDKVLEKIINDTFIEIMSIKKKGKGGIRKDYRPKKIYLYGANQQYLIKIMLGLYDKFEAKRIKKIEIFTENPPEGVYSVDVGDCLEQYLKVSPPKVS